MARVGVEGYSPKGEAFDPNVHEAMAQQPVDGAETGTVVEVYQQGYRLTGDVVIRPARVIVAALMAAGPLQGPRASTRRRRRTRSRRRTASSPASTTPTATRTTRRPRSGSRRSSRPTTSSATPTSASSTTAAGSTRSRAAAARRRPGRRLRRRARSRTSSPTSSAVPPAAARAAGGRGGAQSRARARPRPRDRGLAELRAGGRGRAGLALGADEPRRARPAAAPAPSRARAPKVCPRCQGRGVESQGQGLFSISQPCSQCAGQRHGHRGPVPDVHGQRRHADGQEVQGQHPRRRARGQPHPPRRQGRARARSGGPPGDLFVVTHVADSPVFKRKGDHLEVEVPLTIPEALRGGEIEVPTLNGRKRLRVPPGTKHGTVQRLRGEGPPKLGRQGPRRHPLPLRHRRARPAHARAGEGGRAAVRGHERQPESEAVRMSTRRRTTTRIDGLDRPRRLHDLGRRRAGRDAPADAAHVRGARADRAQALAEGHAPVLAGRRRAAAAHPGDDRRARA